jgi:DNA-binding transcriptional regulator YiaG
MVPAQLDELVRIRRLTRTGEAREIRERARLSQQEIATALGVSVSAIHRWETNDRRPRGAAALRYAELLESLDTRGMR